MNLGAGDFIQRAGANSSKVCGGTHEHIFHGCLHKTHVSLIGYYRYLPAITKYCNMISKLDIIREALKKETP